MLFIIDVIHLINLSLCKHYSINKLLFFISISYLKARTLKVQEASPGYVPLNIDSGSKLRFPGPNSFPEVGC